MSEWPEVLSAESDEDWNSDGAAQVAPSLRLPGRWTSGICAKSTASSRPFSGLPDNGSQLHSESAYITESTVTFRALGTIIGTCALQTLNGQEATPFWHHKPTWWCKDHSSDLVRALGNGFVLGSGRQWAGGLQLVWEQEELSKIPTSLGD